MPESQSITHTSGAVMPHRAAARLLCVQPTQGCTLHTHLVCTECIDHNGHVDHTSADLSRGTQHTAAGACHKLLHCSRSSCIVAFLSSPTWPHPCAANTGLCLSHIS
jgi:hypothetical protein